MFDMSKSGPADPRGAERPSFQFPSRFPIAITSCVGRHRPGRLSGANQAQISRVMRKSDRSERPSRWTWAGKYLAREGSISLTISTALYPYSRKIRPAKPQWCFENGRVACFAAKSFPNSRDWKSGDTFAGWNFPAVLKGNPTRPFF